MGTKMAEIEGLVRDLREGDDAARAAAAGALYSCGYGSVGNKAAIVEAGGIPPLVDLLRDGSAFQPAFAERYAVAALGSLAFDDVNKVLIAEAGGIPPLVQLLRDGNTNAGRNAAAALRDLASNNDANTVAIALAIGLEALVELARRGRVTIDNILVVSNAALPAKLKAALVVAALLRDCVPDEKRSQVRDLIRGVIGPCL